MTLPWETAREELPKWAADLAGVPCDWAHLTRKAARRPGGVRLQMALVSDAPVASPEERKDFDDTAPALKEVTFRAVEQSVYRIQVTGSGIAGKQEKSALPALERLRAKAIGRTARARLKAFGFAVNTIEPIRYLDASHDGRKRPRYVLEIAFNVCAETVVEQTAAIETVGIDVELTSPSGTARSFTATASLG